MTEETFRTIVRTNIKRYRKYRKWTQEKFAEKIGISINFLSEIETGKKWLSPESMVKFASVLNIEPFELFKPADSTAQEVVELFSKYKDEVIKSVTEAINQVNIYYRNFIYKEPSDTDKDEPKPIKTDEIEPYNPSEKPDNDKLVAENQK